MVVGIPHYPLSRISNMKVKGLFMIATLCLSAAGICGTPVEPNPAKLRAALERYLAQQGNLCLGKYDWPIAVSAHDIEVGTRDAVQMPVLEKLGLVVSSGIPATGREGEPVRMAAVTRYALTAAGRKFYLNKGATSAVPGGAKVERRGDFCAAKLSLDRIIGWDELKADARRREIVVTYTYRIAAAPWTRNAEIQKVFPMVDRVIKGEGTMQLKQRFRLTEGGWAAVSL